MISSSSKWLIPVLVGIQAAFAGSTFGTLYVCLSLFGSFALLAMFHRRWLSRHQHRPVSRSLRAVAYTALFSLAIVLVSIWRFSDYAGQSINPMALAFDALTHSALLAVLVLWGLHPIAGHPAMLVLGLLIILLCVAAGGASSTLAGQLAIALAATIGFVLASNLILGHRSRSARRRRLSNAAGPAGLETSSAAAGGGSGRTRFLFSLLVLSAVLMTTTAIAHVTEYVLPAVKATVHDKLTNSLEAIENQSVIGSSRYVRGSRLGSIRRHMLSDPAAIALRAYAQPAPGYLRGTVFDTYSDGRWSAISNERLPISRESPAIDPRDLLASGPGLTRLEGRSRQNLRRFFLYPPDDERISSIEVHNDPLKGPVIFTPLATRWLEAKSSAINVSHHDVILGGVNISNPYVCGVARSPKSETLEPQRRDLLLNIPGGIRAQIDDRARQLSQSRPTAPAKATAISAWFQRNFEYSLSKAPPRSGLDPVVNFLNTKHPAHCEYFATATVLLLRAAGVPARYVTGYVTTEYSEDEDYWLARNRDAHAWVEAYDEMTGTWFPVESTPGRSYQSMSLTDNGNASADDAAALRTDDGSLNESLLSRLWIWITSLRATDPLIVIFRMGQIPLFCVVVLLLWLNFRRDHDGESDRSEIKSKQMLRRLDRKVKKHALIRQPHETLHQFAARIEHDLTGRLANRPRHGDFLTQAARWYRQYASARYRGQMPTPFTLHARSLSQPKSR